MYTKIISTKSVRVFRRYSLTKSKKHNIIQTMRNALRFFIWFVLSMPSLAKADLCAYLDKDTFNKAYEILSNASEYTEYCPICDGAVAKTHIIYKIAFLQPNDSTYEIYINDAPVDIAYTYVDNKNVGLAADCPEIYNLSWTIDVLDILPPVSR